MRHAAGVSGPYRVPQEEGDGHVPGAGGEEAWAGRDFPCDFDAACDYNPDAPSLGEAYLPVAADPDEYDPCCGRPVSVDIETDDVSVKDCNVTCICVWDGVEGRSWIFRPESMESDLALCKEQLPAVLASAPLIYAYNGLSFDLPIMARWLGLQSVLGDWIRKLVDPLAQAKALFGTRACIKLDVWLMQNSLPTKSGSGLEAVAMAREGQWEKLVAYCMRDTELTHTIITRALKSTGEWQHMKYGPGSRDKLFTI